MYASVVFPVPGGPQNIIDGIFPDSKNFLIGPFSPVRCSWPMRSSRVRGLYFDAKGSYIGICVLYRVCIYIGKRYIIAAALMIFNKNLFGKEVQYGLQFQQCILV